MARKPHLPRRRHRRQHHRAHPHRRAREYEPQTGRFITVDPIIDITDPLQMNGYTYSRGNPITNWDPTGLKDDNCAYVSNCTANGGTINHKDTIPSGGCGIFCGGGSTYNGPPLPPNPAKMGSSGGAPKKGTKNKSVRTPPPCSPSGYPAYCTPISSPKSAAADIPDIECPDVGSDSLLCTGRNAGYKFGILTGMTGGSLGFFGLRPGTKWNQLTGLPVGVTKSQMAEISGVLKSELKVEATVAVQGSRVTGNMTGASDLDIAVRVTPEVFNAMAAQRWSGVTPGTARARTGAWAVETGKITAGDAIPRLSGARDKIQGILGSEVDHVDVSIIRIGGPFDNGPFIHVR
ncbi:hypothetical protein OHB39_39300 [Streptomyces sp. NBC_00047]|uniref:RHS repeat-associated core domain-containing protein n=1 Tax=Streptomyces sp. NBC_00047 TaxID=2975627 RepID=UPI00224FE443|nr:RHS repeat-associated core domain-containing protein [Streptomyces sp. NBC_00047]MCX5613494.1 hypothetical protein [Streptomyces sp. NBC_00047]